MALVSDYSSNNHIEDRYVGVRALWIKVIIRAVFDWVTHRDSNRLQQKKLADSAYTWLFEPSELFNSLSGICSYLDVSPEKVRSWAKSMSKDQVAKIEHLERESNLHPKGERLLVEGYWDD